MKHKKATTTSDATAYYRTIEGIWHGDYSYKNDYTAKELKQFREEKLSRYAKNSELVDKDFVRLCKLLKGFSQSVMIETPYGQIHFLKK